MSINRRELLKGAALLGGTSVVAAGLAACGSSPAPAATSGAADAGSVSWTGEYDVVIVGGGGAGYIAAITAAEADSAASVLLLEKMSTGGGSTILSGGNIGAMGTDNLKAYAEKNDEDMFRDDTFDLYWSDKLAAGCWYGDPELARLFAFNSLDNFNWLESLGIKWTNARYYENPAAEPSNWRVAPLMQASQYLMTYDDTGHGSLVNTKFRYNTGSTYKDMTAGRGNFQCLVDTLATYSNATVLFDSPVKSIVRDGQISGEVQGVTLEDGTAYKANRAVILTAGGFGANPEMLHLHDPRIDPNTKCSAGVGCTGEVLVAAQLIGAQTLNMHCIQTDFGNHIDEPSTGPSADASPFGGASDYIDVDSNGKRFWTEKNMNEQYMDAEIMCLHKAGITNWWRIGDSGGVGSNRTPENLAKFEETYGKVCQTVAELASAIGVDGATLQTTIDTYNAAVDAQVDNEFGKSKLYLTKRIETPPFYAYNAAYSCRTTPGGLRINTDAQVMDLFGAPIPRLYAAGEITGNVHGRFRYNGGDSWTDITCFGRIAGNSAIKA